ncbi:hypothetical protein A2533_00165 [Candidatus Falkowbacteria bacterium RIFOXYD2_FULL_35_9]|uniref:Uncharacterized protein n=1 Tax=Candidatus Falkowbacteria bacterium RIFOXYC2_FULL_36_12 TaxID=1798002 RepID=A0A1F5T387_9BACT|nr:MAG: hypothetical protein A2300_01785 [Candidatus Falkowbacteria bacterium RIFOXYB2_FULL_35_7]OGF33418.1 MAG: hypothetical protein A2478_01835 [Candidatus Falkowbacteria bacterium RIFOXYC2_FULL_36_12]OGF33896.1 MAG: hypothetical protein A2223_02465 [Candidatus Falkowbacteria bacterium RIFOXYA2_FULL_35_8]OGF45783.1 MAG: hypothetical protein A2533_00165 [Candidatus Falkowbacteria bacterium RIFOXYD2_FULL_35_9]
MKKNNSIILICAGIIVLVICFVILFFQHKDTLKYYVSSDVNWYLHFEAKSIKKLSENHFNFILAQANKLDMEMEQLKQIINLLEGETAVIEKANNNLQIVTFRNKNLEDFLQKQKITFQTNKKTVLFPILGSELQIKTAVLSDELKTRVINFSDFTFYNKKNQLAFLPRSLRGFGEIEKFYAYLSYKDQGFQIQTTIPSSFEHIDQNSFVALDILNLQPNIWLNNVNLGKLPINPEESVDNLWVLLAKNVDGAVEIQMDNENTVIAVKNSTTEEVKKAIQFVLAKAFPTKVTKILPDGSEANNLVATPEKWKFLPKNNGVESIVLNNFTLFVFEQSGQVVVTDKNPDSINVNTSNNHISSLLERCKVKNLDFVYSKIFSGFEYFLITENHDDLYICLH